MTIHEMRTMGTSGDTKILWDADNEDEVAERPLGVSDLRKKGYAAFAVAAKGKQGEKITEFDPEAESLIMVPAIQGG